MHFLQISAHSKSDTDEVALECIIERETPLEQVL